MSVRTGRVLELVGPSAGGIRRHVDVLARHLPTFGWTPVVGAPSGVMDGLATPATPVPVSMHPLRAVTAVRRVRHLARDVEVIHAHGLTAGWLAWAAHPGRPVVVTIHNVVLDEAAGRSAGVLRRLQAWLPGHVDRTIAVSSEIASHLPSGERITVIVPASDPPQVTRDRHTIRALAGVADDAPLVVTVARLHPQKAIGDLLAAAAQLRDGIDRLQVVIVGDGPSRSDLEAEARRLGVEDIVSFVGSQPDGSSWMAAADVVCVSSIWEGSPLVVAEALQLGVPLVATDVGDVAEIVSDGTTGRLVPPSSPSSLAEALASTLADPVGSAAMAARGQVLAVERYGVEALVQAVADVYADLTPEGRQELRR